MIMYLIFDHQFWMVDNFDTTILKLYVVLRKQLTELDGHVDRNP